MWRTEFARFDVIWFINYFLYDECLLFLCVLLMLRPWGYSIMFYFIQWTFFFLPLTFKIAVCLKWIFCCVREGIYTPFCLLLLPLSVSSFFFFKWISKELSTIYWKVNPFPYSTEISPLSNIRWPRVWYLYKFSFLFCWFICLSASP